jgi:hypothetical protein
MIDAPNMAGTLSNFMPSLGSIRTKDIDRTAGRFDIERAGHGARCGVVGLRAMAWRCLVACAGELKPRRTRGATRADSSLPLIEARGDALYRCDEDVPSRDGRCCRGQMTWIGQWSIRDMISLLSCQDLRWICENELVVLKIYIPRTPLDCNGS